MPMNIQHYVKWALLLYTQFFNLHREFKLKIFIFKASNFYFEEKQCHFTWLFYQTSNNLYILQNEDEKTRASSTHWRYRYQDLNKKHETKDTDSHRGVAFTHQMY